MSYCRWSSNFFRCDVYAYQAEYGYDIHVASRRRLVPEEWGDPLADLDGTAQDTLEGAERIALYNQRQAQLDDLPVMDIGTKSAGQTFKAANLDAFKARMLALRAEGIRFPDDVIQRIDEELLAEITHA